MTHDPHLEAEISERLDRILVESEGLSADAMNVVHACHRGHPLGAGSRRYQRFQNAGFVLKKRRGVPQNHVDWLYKMASHFYAQEAARKAEERAAEERAAEEGMLDARLTVIARIVEEAREKAQAEPDVSMRAAIYDNALLRIGSAIK